MARITNALAAGVAMLALLTGAAPDAGPAGGMARFDWLEYRGQDGDAVPAGQYRNPVLAGFHPDPSITRVGDDFYLVNSSFSWFPGIPVWHSPDLVHWRQIGNAISRPGQLDFARLGMSRGVFAPDISHHAGRFYIVNTCVDCGGNFVITATDPAGPWSDPVWLPSVEGIDPSLFFDTDGTAWMVNNRAPAGKPLYDGHRALWIERFDPVALKMMGNPKMLVDGGVDIRTKPSWIEGPHIFRHDGQYYLTAAEGGTGDNHSQVVFRSDRVDGPYRPAPAGVNPILTQRTLDPSRPSPTTSAGHADLVELKDGSWWATFLATRPYRGDLYNIGRETFLLPVTWNNGWPGILGPGKPIPALVAAPRLPQGAAPPTTGSFVEREEFAGAALGPNWMGMRNPQGLWRLAGGQLVMTPGADAIGDFGRPSFVALRQRHNQASVTTSVRFQPAEGAEAGLAAVMDDRHFIGLGVTRIGGRLAIRAFARDGQDQPAIGRTLAERPLVARAPVRLRIVANGARYDLDYAVGQGPWQAAARDVDGTVLSTAHAGGFTGVMIGPFARAAAR